jgi:hypothetical protein
MATRPAAGNLAIRWASAVPLGEVCVVILGAQQDFERAGAAHDPREVLGGAAAGNLAERRLELREDRRLARREAHVARQHELAAGGANAPVDLRDADEAARAQVAKQQRDGSFAGQLRGLRPVLRDPRQVDVRDEVVGVRALEHQHLERRVRFGSLNQGDEITDEFGPEKIHRRGDDLGEEDSSVDVRGECLEGPAIGWS